jgi:hypothetical protein
MRKVFKRKVYDSNKGEVVASCSSGVQGNANYAIETLRRTDKGNFFLVCQGRTITRCAESNVRVARDGQILVVLNAGAAKEWLSEVGHDEKYIQLFGSELTEA